MKKKSFLDPPSLSFQCVPRSTHLGSGNVAPLEHTVLHSRGGSCEVLIVLTCVKLFCKSLPDFSFCCSKGISYSALAVSDNGTFVGTGTMSEVYKWKLSLTLMY